MSERKLYHDEFAFYGYIIPLEIMVHEMKLKWFLRCHNNPYMFEIYLN